MKISNQNTGKAAGSVNGASSKVETNKKGTSSTVESGAMKESSRVDVSDRAQRMQKAKEIASDPSIDEAKVARLQKLIDDGKYKVDADAIADRMVDTAMLFPD